MAESIIELEGCTVEGHEKCKVGEKEGGKIKTSPLTSKTVFTSKKAAETKNNEETGLLSKPTAGTTFIGNLELTGECPKIGKFEVKGEVLVNDVEGGRHLQKHELVWSTSTSYWSNASKVPTEGKVTPLSIEKTEFSSLVLLIIIIGTGVGLGVWLFS